MTEIDPAIAVIIAALAILSLADYLIVSGCVWAAAKIFRYRKKDKKIPRQIAAYSLKIGLIVAVPFALAIYISAPSLQDILNKGLRLLLPLGLVFIIKTAVFFQKMKDLYGESMKKTVYGFLAAAYLIIVAWVFTLLLFAMMLAACSVLAAILGLYTQSDNWQLTGWWDVQPIGSGSYNASSSSFSVQFMNRMGEQIKIDAAEALDLNSEAECNVTSPAPGETVDVNGTFALNAACPGNTSAGSPYEFVLEIHYTTANNSLTSLFENGYFSGNASE
jgi:uncharacterized membrane protein